MGKAKRIWTAELDKVDNGFFATTPFFISFAQPASELRKAYYGYLLGLVSLYESENEQAAEWLRGLALRKLMRFTEAEQVLQEIEAAKKLSPNDFRIYAFEQIKDTF